MGIQPADFAGRRLKQCSILSAAARRWVVSAVTSLGNRLSNQRYKHSLRKGPLPLYKEHRVNECALIGIFRVAQ
jgi:hypothetical protein